jgi:hypothetical protein
MAPFNLNADFRTFFLPDEKGIHLMEQHCTVHPLWISNEYYEAVSPEPKQSQYENGHSPCLLPSLFHYLTMSFTQGDKSCMM